jgi:hypothetical protein
MVPRRARLVSFWTSTAERFGWAVPFDEGDSPDMIRSWNSPVSKLPGR